MEQAGTLWPGGEISLVGLIKLHVLPTDQQSLRIMLLDLSHTKQVGRAAKAAYLKALLVVGLVTVALKENITI